MGHAPVECSDLSLVCAHILDDGSALNGGLEPIRPIELSFSLLSNLFGAYLTVRLEQVFDGVKFRPATQWTILFFFLITLIQYISFELNTPWWNYFGSN